MYTSRLRLRSALSAALIFAAAAVHAQTYPAKPVRVVVPFPPGAGADITTRLVTPRLSEALGQQFVVDNRPGAAGHIGGEIVAHSPADGYTLLSTPASIVISASLYKKLPYNLERDLEPVGMMASTPFILVVHPSLPVKTVKDFVALAKQKPGQLLFASTGNGGTPHLAMERLMMQTGIKLTHVPYKGTPPAVTDVISGQVQTMFANTLSVLPHIKSGRLRSVAIGSLKRSAATPDIPTFDESGVKDFEAITWFGMLAPTGTPREVIQRVNAEINKAVASPEVREKLIGQGADPFTMTPQEFKKFFSAEMARWPKIVKAAGVTLD
ncbi:MAG TPA: tripartite tricarboxylate transporter substrate binding protein [Burkholderiales bacterium]|nr:tripartite tricarboxylate transporter substrate binding protein [Burkholderiales bacterium]